MSAGKLLRCAPWRVLVLLLAALAGPVHAAVAVFCVGTPGELTAAIVTGRLNHQPDEYRLRRGIFVLPATVQVYAFDAQGATFSGGWSPDCGVQGRDPGATVLDAQGAFPLLDIREPGQPPVRFALDHLTLRGGHAVAANVVTIQGTNATVSVAHCVFEDNFGSGSTRALLSIRTGKPVDVLDNAFTGNVFDGHALDIDLVSPGQPDTAVRRVLNNTFAFNPSNGGTTMRNGRAATVANNLAWGNATVQDLSAGAGSVVLGNNLQHGSLVPGNSSIDPQLRPGSWRLSGISPLRDAGVDGASTGAVSTHDLGGDARVLNGTIDVGADELGPTLFEHGFE